MSPSPDRGQATVELALVLPIITLLLLVVVQVGLVVRDQVLVVQAAREAARSAAVDPSDADARRAAEIAGPLDPSRLQVSVGPRGAAGQAVRVEVRYRCEPSVPVIGPLLHALTLRADATFRVES